MKKKEILFSIDNLNSRYSYLNIDIQLDTIKTFKCTEKYYNDWNSCHEYITFAVRKIDARDLSNKFMIINNNTGRSIPIIPYCCNGKGCAILPYFIDTEDNRIVKITGLLLTRKYIKKYSDAFILVWPDFCDDYVYDVDINTDFINDNLIKITQKEFINRNGNTVLESKGITCGTDILIIEDKIYHDKALTIHFGTLLEPKVMEYDITNTNKSADIDWNKFVKSYYTSGKIIRGVIKEASIHDANIKTITPDYLDTSTTTDMSNMFKNVKNLDSSFIKNFNTCTFNQYNNTYVNNGPGAVKDVFVNDGPGAVKDVFVNDGPGVESSSKTNPIYTGNGAGKCIDTTPIVAYAGEGYPPKYGLTGVELDHIYNVGDTYFDLISKNGYVCTESGDIETSKWTMVVNNIDKQKKESDIEKYKALAAIQYAKANNDSAFLKLVETVEREQEIAEMINREGTTYEFL